MANVSTCPRCGCVFGSHWSARIAELEAELQRWKDMANAQAKDSLDALRQAEAIVERLRAEMVEQIAFTQRIIDKRLEAEAELAEVTEDRNGFREAFNKCIERAEDAEADLAALKGQRCEGCRHIGGCYIFDRAVNHTKPYFGNFACNRWAERGAKP